MGKASFVRCFIDRHCIFHVIALKTRQFMSLIHNSCAITTACYNHFSHCYNSHVLPHCATTAMCYPIVIQQPCVTPLCYNSHVTPLCYNSHVLPHCVTTAMCYPIVLQQPCVTPLCYNSHVLNALSLLQQPLATFSHCVTTATCCKHFSTVSLHTANHCLSIQPIIVSLHPAHHCDDDNQAAHLI